MWAEEKWNVFFDSFKDAVDHVFVGRIIIDAQWRLLLGIFSWYSLHWRNLDVHQSCEVLFEKM